MILFHRIEHKKFTGNFNTPEELKKAVEQNQKITFDGVYESVYKHRELLRGADVILFIMGDTVGKDNGFDTGEPLTRFCNWDQLFELQQEYGCELGWHTWSHRDLRSLPDDELRREVEPPFFMDSFAYPYGEVDERVERFVREADYAQAYSVDQGNGTCFQKNRRYWA